jgi:GNAT superfamily N-acetyltransferase
MQLGPLNQAATPAVSASPAAGPQIQIGPMTQAEWPWFITSSVANGWDQMPPANRQQANQQQVMRNLYEMTVQALGAPGSTVLVARVDGKPAGYLMATLMPDEWTHEPAGHFYDIWVDPQWRGKGVSTALTRAGEEYFRSLGCRLVRRFIGVHNAASLRHAESDGAEPERICFTKRL